MTKVELIQAGILLDVASEKFSNHCCNDWYLHDNLENRDLISRMYKSLGGVAQDFNRTGDGRICIPDWMMMRYIAQLCLQEAENL